MIEQITVPPAPCNGNLRDRAHIFDPATCVHTNVTFFFFLSFLCIRRMNSETPGCTDLKHVRPAGARHEFLI